MPKDDEPVPNFEADPPAREGYLWKRSDHIKKWNKRWFVLWPQTSRPGDGRVLFWFNAPGDKKLRGTVKLVPGSFNIQCTEAPAAKKKKKGERDFPLTVLIEVPNRDPVRLATDNDREMRGWVEAMQSRDSPSAADARASAAGGGGGGGGGLGAPPAGAGLRPNLAATRTKGFGGQSAPQGRSAAFDSSDPTAVLKEALLLFLPGADVAAGGRDLLAQARHAASQKEAQKEQEGDLAAAQRKAEVLEGRLRTSEANAAALGDSHATELAQINEQLATEQAQAEESASELRGENRLLQADIESLKSQLAAAARGEAGSPGPAEAFDDVRRAAGGGETVPAERAAELEAESGRLREELTQAKEEVATLKARLEHSESSASQLQVDNRGLRARLESQADGSATEAERLAEVQQENSELMAAVMEARAATTQAETLAASEKATADTLREERAGVDQALEDAIAATEAEKEQVVSLNAELEALSEALADDSAGAEKLEESQMMIEELETALAEEAEGKATAEAALAESETKLKQAVDMAREKVMALSKENAELRKGKKR